MAEVENLRYGMQNRRLPTCGYGMQARRLKTYATGCLRHRNQGSGPVGWEIDERWRFRSLGMEAVGRVLRNIPARRLPPHRAAARARTPLTMVLP